MTHLIPLYKPLPMDFVRGEGIWLFDKQGERYFDAFAGIAVSALGHSHPRFVEAICSQMHQVIHLSNALYTSLRDELADKLFTWSGFAYSCFGSSGAEAIEAVIKLTRFYGHSRQINNPQVIVMNQAFHGRTFAALSASGSAKIHAGCDPLLPGFIHIPYNDLPALHDTIANHPSVVAILLEPIQGESGIIIPDNGYLPAVRELCNQHQLMMIIDEIQTGIARTGRAFAYQHHNIVPDAITLAKALGNGIPIGACLVNNSYQHLFTPGSHGSTFGGNPLAMRAGITTLDIIKSEGLIEHAAQMGTYLQQQLRSLLSDIFIVKEVRGKGLLQAIELDRPTLPLRLALAEQQKILITTAGQNCLRLAPPLIITHQDIDYLCAKLAIFLRKL